jgi:two-component system sensor histidine kinase AlgZ
VENALRHGIAKRAANSVVSLRTERRNGTLTIAVYNDGPQLPGEWNMENCAGFGLANTRARLQQHYPHKHTFLLSNKGTEGVEARLTIPFSAGAPS